MGLSRRAHLDGLISTSSISGIGFDERDMIRRAHLDKLDEREVI
jgi:hypothetical protein